MAETATLFLDRFSLLFSGYENLYGQCSSDRAPVEENGKLKATHWTERGAPQWARHLEGKVGLGIIPLKIDNSVSFGAIDVDVYDGLDHAALARRVKSLGLPLVVCRSKSGGAHLYLFLKEPAPAGRVIDKLSEWAAILGHGKSEIFPKQRERMHPEDIGNWINLPYFGGARTTRYAVDEAGKALALERFLDVAEAIAVDPKKLAGLDVTPMPPEVEELLQGAPPCMCIAYSSGGFPPGTRNDSMFNAAVFCKKKFGDDWQVRLKEINTTLCSPPLSETEIAQLVKSVQRRDSYEMRCNGPNCNKRKCRQASFGRGPLYTELGIDVGNVTKIVGDEAQWYIDVDDCRVRMSTKHLLAQSQFNMRLVEAVNKVTQILPGNKWLDFIRTAILEKADVISLPKEATWDGQFWHTFVRFTSAIGYRAGSPREIMLGKVYQVEGTADVVFLPSALFEFLAEARFFYEAPEQVWAALLDRGVKPERFRVEEMEVEVWRIQKPQDRTTMPTSVGGSDDIPF